MIIRHLFEDAPFKWTLLEGAKGVQLAEAGLRSWKERWFGSTSRLWKCEVLQPKRVRRHPYILFIFQR